MDFFAQQDSARRRTSLLVAYFVAAVVLIVLTLNLAVAVGLGYAGGSHRPRRNHSYTRIEADRPRPPAFVWRTDAVAWTTGLTLAVIAAGALYRRFTLREGGRAVARIAGGRELAPGSAEPAERRLLNIVEEMSIASGVPMPAVFVLDDEPGLNAFAAGFTPSDAAVAVTRGCLEKLSRDELQGVVAHEFSHLLNGDMRLNIRLVGVLFGILMLAMLGRGLLHSLRFAGAGRSSRREKGGGGIAVVVALGLVLLLVGYIGYFFGRLIQAAVSRQREFLADAAAVQFTRNPAGIGGALKKIGAYAIGSGITSAQATQFNHFFFAQAFSGAFSPFATHPPLAERIHAIEPQWDGVLPEVPTLAPGQMAAPRPLSAREQSEAEREIARSVLAHLNSGDAASRPPPLPVATPIATAALVASVGAPSAAHLERARELLAAIPPRLAAAARAPAESCAVVFALLFSRDAAVRQRQEEVVRVRHGVPFAEQFAALLPLAAGLSSELRLPLLNLALPALRSLPAGETAGMVETAKLLIAADGEMSLFEFMFEKALERHVAAPSRGERPRVVNYYSYGGLAGEIGLLLSALARVGSDSSEETARAFAAAAARIPALQGQLRLRPVEMCTLELISAALDKLVQASPAIRKVVLVAGTEAVAADGTVEADEADLLRAVADALDCPIPPLLGGGAA
ncbi:MAG: M48 family metallopeptidase [Opitutaceae bacterium]